MTLQYISGSYSVAQGQTIYDAGDTPTFVLQGGNLPAFDPTFTLNGAMHVGGYQALASVFGDSGNSHFANSLIKISTTGELWVTANGFSNSTAYGYRSGAWSVPFENDGYFSVTAAQAAYGVALYANTFTTQPNFKNTGTFQAQANYATSIYTAFSTTLINTSTIFAIGGTRGVGIWADSFDQGSVSNSGTILATSNNNGAAIGIAFGGHDYGTAVINNTGVIQGSTAAISEAVYQITDDQSPVLHLTNSGRLTGGVILGIGQRAVTYSATAPGSTIINTGLIQGGGVHLSDNGNDTYDGTGGQLTNGAIYLSAGLGRDTVLLGNDGETVYAGGAGPATITGGSGNDTITAGAGNDLIDLGKGGADVVNGGGGVNTVSFASATQGVTVSLAQQGVAQATGIGSMKLSNFSKLVGSGFADMLSGGATSDTINGGAGKDTISGGGGGDLLTGGSGADTFVFAPDQTGQTTITDFSRADGDKVDLSAFTNLRSVADVAAHAHQIGAVTPILLVDLGNGLVVEMDGVSYASMSAADFILTANNTAPTISIPNQTLAIGGSVLLGGLMNYSDTDGDLPVTYRLMDTDGSVTSGYISDANSDHEPASTNIDIDRILVAPTTLHAGSAPGTEAFKIQVFDGRDWSAWSTFTLTTRGDNHAPTASIANQTLAAGATASLAALINYADADTDAAVSYRFWDDGGGATTGYISDTANAHEASGAAFTVAASDIANAVLHAGSAAGVEGMWVQAFDGTDWSPWQHFTLTTTGVNHAPTTSLADQTLAAGATVNLAGLIHFADADNDAAVSYQLWDDGSAASSGYFSDTANAHEAAGATITVAASDFANIMVHGGAAAGGDTLWVRAFDGHDWSNWAQFQLLTA